MAAKPVTPEQADYFRRWQSSGGRTKMLTDERGIRYTLDRNGKPLYYLDYETSPVPKTNFFSDMAWDPTTGTYKRTTNKGRVAGIAALGVIGGGIGAAAAGGGGGAAAAPSLAGSTGASAAAPTVAGGTGAAMAGNSWLGPLLNYGIPAVSNVVDRKMQNSADAQAAKIYADYLDRALAVEKEKEQYGRGERANYLSRLKPYGDAGQAATGRASQLLSTGYRPELNAPGAQAGQGMVRLADSTGQIREVPAAMAEQFIAQGARRV